MGGKLEPEKIFGTPVLVQAWLKAVASHPLVYLRHRLGHMEAFLTIPHSAIYLESIGKYRTIPTGSYAVAMSASAVAYVATFLLVGVASDYRYVYWVVAAGLTSAVMTALARQTSSSSATSPDYRAYPRETAKRLELKGPSGNPV